MFPACPGVLGGAGCQVCARVWAHSLSLSRCVAGERRGAGGRVRAQGPRRGGHPGRALQGGQGGQRVPAGPLQGQEGETQVVNARQSDKITNKIFDLKGVLCSLFRGCWRRRGGGHKNLPVETEVKFSS